MTVTQTHSNSRPFDRRALAEDVVTATQPRVKTVALLDWSQSIEDYLDNINISFEEFCNQMSGGWMFGYIEALKVAGVRTVLFCVSARVSSTSYFTHAATGARICVSAGPAFLPSLAQAAFESVRGTVEEAVGVVGPVRRLLWGGLREVLSYRSTPVLSSRVNCVVKNATPCYVRTMSMDALIERSARPTVGTACVCHFSGGK